MPLIRQRSGTLRFALASFVAITSGARLLSYIEPKPIVLGIANLVAAPAADQEQYVR